MFGILPCKWECKSGKKKKEECSLIFQKPGACVFSPRTNGRLTSAATPSLTALGGTALKRTSFRALALTEATTFIERRGKQEGKLSGFTAEIPRDDTLVRLLSLWRRNKYLNLE